jgi:hypothetical protein
MDPASPLAVPDKAPPVLIPVLPGISGWSRALPRGLCIAAIDPAFEKEHSFPPPELLSPALLAAATRGIYDLIAAAPERGKPRYPRLQKSLAKGPWRRRGIYLTCNPAIDTEGYAALFRRFLEGGFLLPPSTLFPVILPDVLSPGEEAKLGALLAVHG